MDDVLFVSICCYDGGTCHTYKSVNHNPTSSACFATTNQSSCDYVFSNLSSMAENQLFNNQFSITVVSNDGDCCVDYVAINHMLPKYEVLLS